MDHSGSHVCSARVSHMLWKYPVLGSHILSISVFFSENLMKEWETSKYIEFIFMSMATYWKLLRYFSYQPLHTMSGKTFPCIFINISGFIWTLKIILLKGHLLSLHSAHCLKQRSFVKLRSLYWDLKCCTLGSDIWHRISFLFRKLTARNLIHWARLPSESKIKIYVKEALLSELHSS